MSDRSPAVTLYITPIYVGSSYGELALSKICADAGLRRLKQSDGIDDAYAAALEDEAVGAIGAVASAVCERGDVGVAIDGDLSLKFADPAYPTSEDQEVGVVMLSERLWQALPSLREIMPELIAHPEVGRYFYLDPFDLSYRVSCYLFGESPD